MANMTNVQVFISAKPDSESEPLPIAIVSYDDDTQTFWKQDSDRSALDSHTKAILDSFFNGV